MNNMNNLLLINFLLIILLIFLCIKKEFYPIMSPSTRNMSYDLRCEPIINKQNYYFFGSSILPKKQYKCLTDNVVY